MSLLRIENLEVNYGAVRALKGISFEVEKGSMVTLLGSNGAGKSSTLKAISGTVKPSVGRIYYGEQLLTGKTPNQIVRLGIAQVPEGRKIFKDLTTLENLRMGAYVRKDKAGIAKDFELVLDMFPRLAERAKQLGGSLSGGEQQMLAIGRGLMANPSLLLLDEPSLGLAPLIVADIFTKLREINQEKETTILVVEQNANIALKHCNYGYVLQLGKVVLHEPAEDLRKNRAVIESYLGTCA